MPVAGPGEQTRFTLRLAEREVELLKGFAVRRLLADGRQAAVVTIQLDLSMECVAGPLMSRWTQENFSSICARISTQTPARARPSDAGGGHGGGQPGTAETGAGGGATPGAHDADAESSNP